MNFDLNHLDGSISPHHKDGLFNEFLLNNRLIQVDDDRMLHDTAYLMFKKEEMVLDHVAVTCLDDYERELQKRKYGIALLDGCFPKDPTGSPGFYLPNAVRLAIKNGVHSLFILSSEPLTRIKDGLLEFGIDRVPDAIFGKGAAEEGKIPMELLGETVRKRLAMIYDHSKYGAYNSSTLVH